MDSYKLQSKDIEEPSGSLQIGFKSAWTDLIRSKPDYRYYSLRSAKFSSNFLFFWLYINKSDLKRIHSLQDFFYWALSKDKKLGSKFGLNKYLLLRI